MAIVEGLDGVKKMSKSYGNAIGIKEAALEMYGKLMSVSDEMMWRYYELLTDVQIAEIEKTKRESHPMQAKKDLAARIVKDFHSVEAAAKAAEDWAKQFQKDEVPENVEEVSVNSADISGGDPLEIRLDRLLVHCGLADSVTDAVRKLRQGSVRVEGMVRNNHTYQLNKLPVGLPIRVGKRVKIAVIQGRPK